VRRFHIHTRFVAAAVLLVGMISTALASASQAEPADEGPVLEAEWLYNGIDRPTMLRVRSPQSFGTVTLALLDHEGSALADPIEVRPGRVDLHAVLPGIRRLRRAAYLQAIVAGEPAGSALVVQPMLSRLIPVTEEAVSPSGFTYKRIVDWYDEGHPPTTKEEAGDGEEPAIAPAPLPPTTWLAPPEDTSRLCAGVRIYREQDVILYTTEGNIRLAMRPDAAPNTAWNFMQLCAGGFYRDIPFHRIVPYTRDGDPFVIQAGDPTGTGSGGPGYWLPIERSLLPHDFGVISMARDNDPDSAGSQIFICLSRAGTARLDESYCAFGETVRGVEVIRTIAAAELADVAAGRPLEPPLIVSAALGDAPPRVPGTGRPDRPVVDDAPGEAPAPPARLPR
jgi:peptidyl-prolyl cis-trans isomerase B (cyclophilin B)